MERNGRSSWEQQGIVTFCKCLWNEWILLLIMHLLVYLCLHLTCNSCITLPWKISPAMMRCCMVRWQVPLKDHYACICLHTVTSQQTFIFVVIVMITWHHIKLPSYTMRKKLCYSLHYCPEVKMMVMMFLLLLSSSLWLLLLLWRRWWR